MDNWLLPFKADFARPKVGYDSRAVMLTPPGDHLAHTIQISCYDGDSPVDVTAYTAAGHFRRRDGNVVLVEDTVNISANVVTLVLPQECYAYPGVMHGIVRLTNAQTGGKITILDMWFIVPDSVDGGTIDPGEVIPSIDDLLAEIEAMETATAAAQAIVADAQDDFRGLYNAVYGANGAPLVPTPYQINGSNVWDTASATHVCIPCKAGDKIIITANDSQKTHYAFLASDTAVSGQAPDFADNETGRYVINAKAKTQELTAPQGTNWLYLLYRYNNVFYPKSVLINGMEQNTTAAMKAQETNQLIDDVMAQAGIVPYWVNGTKTLTGASVEQEYSTVTLNGYNSGNAFRIVLSGTLAIGTGTTVISGTSNTIRLKGGHTYKVKIEALGGTAVLDEGATLHVRAGLYTGTSTTSEMTMAALTSGVSLDWQTFTPETDGYYKLAMLANAKNTYTDYKVRVVLTDITEWVSA